jgi:hypothetical protein
VFASFDVLGMESKGVICDFFLCSEEKSARAAEEWSVDGLQFCIADVGLDNRDGNFFADSCSPVLTQDNIDNIFDLVVVVGFQIVEFEFVDNNNTGILLVKFFIFIKNLVRV